MKTLQINYAFLVIFLKTILLILHIVFFQQQDTGIIWEKFVLCIY